MTHNARTHPDGFYGNAVPIAQDYFRALDTAQSKALFAGKSQGAGYADPLWTPSAPIAIAGAGVMLCGGSQTTVGPTIVTGSGSGKRIVHAAGDVPNLVHGHQLAARDIFVACRTAVAIFDVPQSTFTDLGVMRPGFRFLLPLDVHDAATFIQATLTIGIGLGHFAVPSSLPQMRVYAADMNGIVYPLGSVPGSEGWQSIATPASPAVYNGSTQTLTYPINGGTGVPIDAANFTYVAEIRDEAGTGALPGNQYHRLIASFTGIVDMRAH